MIKIMITWEAVGQREKHLQWLNQAGKDPERRQHPELIVINYFDCDNEDNNNDNKDNNNEDNNRKDNDNKDNNNEDILEDNDNSNKSKDDYHRWQPDCLH